MNRIIVPLFFALLLSLAACSSLTPTATIAPAAPTPADSPTPSAIPPTPSPTLIPSPTIDPHFPAEVQAYVVQLVEQRKVPGIAIGLLTPEGSFFFNYGASTWKSEQRVDEHTLFEIGSITKVFSALLLANAVEEGLLTLDTPAQDLLPEGVTAPSYQDQPITLRVLASHRSGLPRMPSNFNPAKSSNPYIDYTEKELYEYVSGFKLMQKIGSHYEYSNLGYLLLGRLLELPYGKPYETLVTEIITDPLGMPDTRITLSEDQKARFAQAHTDVYPTSAWDFALPGAGALRSTTTDMLRFLAANLAPDQSQLGDAMRLIREECYETGTYFVQVCLGIHTYTRYGKLIYQHDGQTGGYHSFAGFLPEEGSAVIVLVNSNYDINALGLHLLDPRVPLPDLE